MVVGIFLIPKCGCGLHRAVGTAHHTTVQVVLKPRSYLVINFDKLFHFTYVSVVCAINNLTSDFSFSEIACNFIKTLKIPMHKYTK